MAELLQIPVWNDNYAYLLISGTEAFVVDSPEAEPILAVCKERGVKLVAVVNTHHHPDHVGSNLELKEATGCEIVGNANDEERIPGITRAVRPGESIVVAGKTLRVLDVSGHTRGHVAYVLDEPVGKVVRHGHEGEPIEIARFADRPAIFIGDTIFMAGCGRLFEGTPAEMGAAFQLVMQESPDALLCCAHEYTAASLKFARHALPDHEGIKKREAELDDERGASRSSVPDTLARERETNPFLLCFDQTWRPKLAARFEVAADDPAVVLGAVRAAKDSF
jgi:hydroxyacylglutathione hydrolase